MAVVRGQSNLRGPFLPPLPAPRRLNLPFALWPFSEMGHKSFSHSGWIRLWNHVTCTLISSLLLSNLTCLVAEAVVFGRTLKFPLGWTHTVAKKCAEKIDTWLLCCRWTNAFSSEPWHQCGGLAAAGELKNLSPVGPRHLFRSANIFFSRAGTSHNWVNSVLWALKIILVILSTLVYSKWF